MPSIQRVILSGASSSGGDPIKVTTTATPGDLLHTAVSGTSQIDEVSLDVTNTDSSARTITVEWGGVTDPDHLICKAISIPANTHMNLIDRIPINNGNAIRAFASTANVLLITGKVARHSP